MTEATTVLKRIMAVADRDGKDINAMTLKVFEEGGELAESVNVHTGVLTHKTLKEPLVGEVADLIQCSIAVLVKATPDLTADARLQLLVEWLDKKTDKWEAILPPVPTKTPTTSQTKRLRNELAALGIVPDKASFLDKLVVSQQLKQKPMLPKVHVLIRVHPAGIRQPTGERRVYRMDTTVQPGRVFVGIGSQYGNGEYGWDLDLSKQTPSFLTFRVNGSKLPVTLQDAVEYWKRHGGPAS